MLNNNKNIFYTYLFFEALISKGNEYIFEIKM